MEILKQAGFESADESTVQEHGLALEQVAAIVTKLKAEPQYVTLRRAATRKDGVRNLPDVETLAARFDQLPTKPGKFTPMSGAASRMFGFLGRALAKNPKDGDESKVERFINGLDEISDGPQLPFRSLLAESLRSDDQDLQQLIAERNYHPIIDHTLNEGGLAFRGKPKAVIPFHRRDGRAVVPLEEHMKEAVAYADGRLHITISPEDEALFSDALEQIHRDNESLKHVEITHSVQHPSTDSVALDSETGRLVRDQDGHLAFFPAGHGSLLLNIHELAAPAVLRNVDNVPKSATAQRLIQNYHRAMAVILHDLKAIVTEALVSLEEDRVSEQRLDSYLSQLRDSQLHLLLDWKSYQQASLANKKTLARQALARPLKIVGVVPNEGEPGGGPFVIDYEGNEIVSIVEKAEIAPGQKSLMQDGEFFNPVDILVDPTDHHGKTYDLPSFVNGNRHFLVRKPYRGREVIRLEHPGLWNGAMDGYNSLFVALPLETFAPVKEVIDLLRPEHQQD